MTTLITRRKGSSLMRHITRPLACVFALMLAFGGPVGANAQSTASGEFTVMLINHLCSIDVSYAGGGFGTWRYVPDASLWRYEHASGPTTIQIHGAIQSSPPEGGCSVTVAFDGLYLQGSPPPSPLGRDMVVHIPAVYFNGSAFSAYSSFSGTAMPASGWTHTGVTGTYDFSYTLVNPAPYAPPGTWTGVIDVYVSDTV